MAASYEQGVYGHYFQMNAAILEDILDLVAQGGWEGKALTEGDLQDGLRNRGMRGNVRPKSRRSWRIPSGWGWHYFLRELREYGFQTVRDEKGNATRIYYGWTEACGGRVID